MDLKKLIDAPTSYINVFITYFINVLIFYFEMISPLSEHPLTYRKSYKLVSYYDNAWT